MKSPAPHDTMPPLFKSLGALRRAHTQLLMKYEKYEEVDDANILPVEFIDEVDSFLNQASKSGALLDIDEDRSDAQALLNYWTTVLYDAGQTPRPTILAKFDNEVASRQIGDRCPYRGLQAFQQEDRAVFYGRRQLARDMTKKLERENFLAVVGLSGSGKSSVVRAELLPRLKEGGLPDSESWTYYEPIVPGPEPLKSLSELTRPADISAEQWHQKNEPQFLNDEAHLLRLVSAAGMTAVVVVDQFEELFTLSQNETERRAFVANLVRLTRVRDPRQIVIITMRSEFDTYLARFPELQELFSLAHIPVLPLTPLDLRKAIEKPAERSGLSFEAGLVEELVQQVLGEPAGLPLLQFTLYKLWENREGKNITRAIYDQLGGSPRDILASVADATYESFPFNEDRNISRRIMLRLVRPGPGLDVLSNRVRRAALSSVAARDNFNRVLDVWVNAGLLRVTPGIKREDDHVEVMHEALIRNWPMLGEWLDEERVRLRKRLQLTADAQRWAERKDDAGGLLRGALLTEALTYDDLNDLEEEFVKQSQLAVDAAARYEREQLQKLADEQKERANQKSKAARYFRFLTISLAFLLIGALGATLSVLSQRNEALRARGDAEKALGLAEQERTEALVQKGFAEEQKGIAEEQTNKAEIARKKAEEAQAVSKTEKKRAEDEREKAKRNYDELQHAIREKEALEKQKDQAERLAESAEQEINRFTIPPERIIMAPSSLGSRTLVRPLRPGLSISSSSSVVGTMCCVVRDSSGRRYLLSADHIIGNQIGGSVIQPGTLDGGTEENRVARVVRVDPSRMMALAELLPGIEFSNTIPGIGKFKGISDEVRPGDTLILIGRTSGAVKGMARAIDIRGMQMQTGSGTMITMNGVIETEKISGPGDSGAPVLDEQGRLVGVLVAGTPETSIIIPIRQILQALNVELEP